MLRSHELFCGQCDEPLAFRASEREVGTYECPEGCETKVFVREVDWIDCPVLACKENYRVKDLPAHFIKYHPGRVRFDGGSDD